MSQFRPGFAPVSALSFALTCWAAPDASAQILPSQTAPDVAFVSLMPGWVQEDGSRMIAIQVDLDQGWKTYWRAPGDAGIPPHFDWSGSENVVDAEAIWPIPDVYDIYGARTIGYDTRLVLPVRVQARDIDQPIHLSLHMQYGVCKEVCIPASAQVVIDLDPGDGMGPDAAIDAALSAQPKQAVGTDGGRVTCDLAMEDASIALVARFAMGDLPNLPNVPKMVVFEAPVPDLWIAPALLEWDGNVLVASTVIEYFGEGPLTLSRHDLRMTVLGDGTALEVSGCASPQG